MGYKDVYDKGDIPGYGAIFMSNTGTKKECFQRKLFGLPLAQSNFVLHVKKGMYLFLFEFEKRQLHGVFRATSDGEIDIEPDAFRSSGKCFPAQVPFISVWNCAPLGEHEFKDAIRDNYFSWKKFKFGLSKNQVYDLMKLFCSKRILTNDPPRTFLRYDDKPTKRDTRFGDNRKRIRDRVRFIKEDHGYDFDEDKELDDYPYRTLIKRRPPKDNKEGFSTSCKKGKNDFGDYDSRQLEKRSPKDYKEGFLTSCKKGKNDFGDYDSRKLEKRPPKDYKEGFLTSCKKEKNDFGDYGSRQLEKRPDRSLRGLRRVHDAKLHFRFDNEMHNNFREIKGITNLKKIKVECDSEDGYKHSGKIRGLFKKNKYYRDGDRIKDEYQVGNGFRQSISPQNDLSSPDRGSEPVVDGWFFRHGTVESQQRALTDHTLSQPNECQNPNREPRGDDFGIYHGSDEEYDLGNFVPPTHNSLSHCDQNNSDFIPISEESEQFQHPCEFNNGYEPDHPYLTSCDPSIITIHTPYDPEVPDFIQKPYDPEVPESCHKSSYFAPGPSSSPVHNPPIYPNETNPYQSQNKDSDFEKSRSKHVCKVSVFDRLNSVPHSHEQENKSDKKVNLDVSVDEVMKMLEKIVSNPIKRTEKVQLSFKQDDDDDEKMTSSKILDCELPKIESDKKVEFQGINGDELILEETRVVDFKRRKKIEKNFDDENKERNDGSTSGTDSDMEKSCKRRKLVRPVFVKKENMVGNEICIDENTSLKDENVEKGGTEGEECVQVEENGNVEKCEVLEKQCIDENTPLKDDCYLEKGDEGKECAKVEEKGNVESCEVLEKQWMDRSGFADVVRLDWLNDPHNTCGWIEE